MAMPRVVVALLLAVPGLVRGVQLSEAVTLDGEDPGNRLLRRMGQAVLDDINSTIIPMLASESSARQGVPGPRSKPPLGEFERIGTEFARLLPILGKISQDGAHPHDNLDVHWDIWTGHARELQTELGKLRWMFRCMPTVLGNIDTTVEALKHMLDNEVVLDTQQRVPLFSAFLAEAAKVGDQHMAMQHLLEEQWYLKEMRSDFRSMERTARIPYFSWATSVVDAARRAKTFTKAQDVIAKRINFYDSTLQAAAAVEKHATRERPLPKSTYSRPTDIAAETMPARPEVTLQTDREEASALIRTWYQELYAWSAQKSAETSWEIYESELQLYQYRPQLVVLSASNFTKELTTAILEC